MSEQERQDEEVYPPGKASPIDDEIADPSGLNILALISNHTDRPDLFLAEIEKHDPGFTKRMNESARLHSERYRDERLTFGKNQAYVALGVSVIAALAVLAIVGIAVWNGQGFSAILALALFYAVTQGGPGGFEHLVEACVHSVKSITGRKEKDKNEENEQQ